ncbi:methionine ABC transporter ATP-binding protein [Clostridium estertheticum]|uniref:methionine ABC transporter ATP-binding protein n=1 Tax=Clostridium estertheticum TaxID=238834 RepID=UPI001C0C2979|nr:methionine ABC transporter ATP-binding protein [Clostridium estertheticum]MBU3177738.1 methionine ABC transporter ATP-binding protein [Clostridium estertheticum]
MIWLKGIRKVYVNDQGTVEALKKIDLHVEKGKIYGIIGYSGAGKSTLIRCINLLEKPTSGKVIVNNRDLTKLSKKDLRDSRKKIGMIFQHFNLMGSRNVFQNVSYPLKGNKYSKEERKQKVLSLLELVGLSDKILAYPSQLSGGQKQRVAIARALANDPQVLLCDEATSAIDPQTTSSILKLLKEINEKLNLTIVIITHQMEVVKEICQEVAIMEDGLIIERGDIIDIFTNPKTKITKDFISTVFHYDKIYDFIQDEEFTDGETIAKISFVGSKTSQSFISILSRKFKIDASILFGNIEIIQHVPIGNLIVKFTGTSDGISGSIKYLEQNNINVEVINHASVSNDLHAKCDGIIS